MRKIIEKIVGKKKREEVEGKKEERKGEVTPLKEVSKTYLKALVLHSLEDLEKIKSEVKSGNILIVKIGPLLERNVEEAKRAIGELSEFIESIGGDIARLGEERIVLTPQNIRIWRDKTSGSEETSI